MDLFRVWRVESMFRIGGDLVAAGGFDIGPAGGHLFCPFRRAVVYDHLPVLLLHIFQNALVDHEDVDRGVERHVEVMLDQRVRAEDVE